MMGWCFLSCVCLFIYSLIYQLMDGWMGGIIGLLEGICIFNLAILMGMRIVGSFVGENRGFSFFWI